jgi:predicted RNA-binding protein with PUA-like domain
MNYWLVKSEPETYSWAQLVQDGQTAWTGVRNYQARNHLRAMQRGDLAFFYHSVSAKQVVGIAKVVRAGYPDPTVVEEDWVCVDLAPVKALAQPVTLDAIKRDSGLRDMALVRQSRLSVTPLTAVQARKLAKLAATELP